MDNDWLNRFSRHYLPDEDEVVQDLLSRPSLTPQQLAHVANDATALVEAVRANPDHFTPLERFLSEYSLGTEEGVLLMCLAETLLRIPDSETANLLIADKLGDADWDQHLGNRESSYEQKQHAAGKGIRQVDDRAHIVHDLQQQPGHHQVGGPYPKDIAAFEL